jgi:hypothetical protein
MANLNNLETPAPISTTNTQILGAGYTLPSGFNNLREPGELSVLYAQNSDAIYNKYKLQTDYNNGLLRFGPRQPFITVNPNNARKGVNGLKRYESRALPIGSALQDVVRVSKFSVSGNGVIFLGKQLVLQGLNTFNETKIYNPLMPILASTSIASFGIIPSPTRHIEPNLGGVLGALGLGAVSNALGLNKPTPPKGTVGAGALPSINKAGGKGLIRGSTATNANKNFQNTWGGGKSAGFLSGVGNFFKSSTLFGAFIPVGQPNGEKYKVGESTYGIMASTRAVFEQPPGTLKHTFDKKVIQKWYAGTSDNTVRKGDTDETTGVRGRYFRQADGTYLLIGKRGPWEGTSIGTFPKVFGQEVQLSLRSDAYQFYGRAVGHNIEPNQEFKNSEMLINLAYYADSKQKYPTKFTDKESDAVKNIEDNLKQVLTNIESAGYTVVKQSDSELINPQFSNAVFKGYDFISQLTKDPYAQQKGTSPFNYGNGGYLTKFRGDKRKQLLDDEDGKGFSGAKYSDKINLLSVLSGSVFDDKYTEDSDLIKFYFYDVVNDKYIPFRATVTGLNENLNADWTAIEYIGRADKLQSYKGFSRTLSFKFNVVANSIKELLPMWQRINYLVGLTKPANYTQGGQTTSNIYSKFIIPPLVKFTIGDIYKYQPAVIKSVGMNIPDNCVWETFSEEYAEKNDWTYLNGIIKLNNSKNTYAQFPRECELNLSLDLLEKERPIAGGNNFGNAWRVLDKNGDYINGIDINQQGGLPVSKPDSFSDKIMVPDKPRKNLVPPVPNLVPQTVQNP